MTDEYIPDDKDLKDWEELTLEQSRSNKQVFVLQKDNTTKEVDRLAFIDYLRNYIVVNIANYATLSRRDIIDILDQKFLVKEELRKFCDLSKTDFETMLNGVSFPYLETAWNSMFHPGLLADIEERRNLKVKRSIKTTDSVDKEVASSGTSKKPGYSLEGIITDTCQSAKLHRTQIVLIKNTIRVLLLRQEIEIRYQAAGITLHQFINICSNNNVPARSIDRVFNTGSLFSNIIRGNTKGSTKQDELKKIFQDIFKVKLVFE